MKQKDKTRKKERKKIKISSIQGKGPQTLLSGGHACLLWRTYQSFRTHGRFALGRFVPR